MSSGLPPGWEMSVDPESGRNFYINHDTMQTSWTPPVEEPLPPGWEQQRDPQGRTYFYDSNTQQTSWEDPRISGAVGGTSAATPSYPSMGEQTNASYNGSIGDTWKCPSCTFENNGDYLQCDMCGTGRNGEGPSDVSHHFNDVEYDQMSQSSEYATRPSELAPYSVPDESSDECWQCHATFNFTNRRHHCKCCGMLFCAKCSSKKAQFRLAGDSYDKALPQRRVCDHCHDHQMSGDRHCFLRYITVIQESDDDRAMAMQGVADVIEVLPGALKDTASVQEAQSAFNTTEAIDAFGGLSTLFDLLDPTDPPALLTQACRIAANVAKAAFAAPMDSQSTISRSNLTKELTQGGGIERISTVIGGHNTPVEAQIQLVRIVEMLADQPEFQHSINSRMVNALCDFLLASSETLQRVAVKAVSRLLLGNGEMAKLVLQNNGIQPLVLLLSSDSNETKQCAAQALASALSPDASSGHSDYERLASVRNALISVGGADPSVKLLSSHDDNVVRAGLQLCQSISESQTEILRSAGAIPLLVALLASRDTGLQNQTVHLLYNLASSTGQSGMDEILDAGGLSMALPLLTSQSSLARRYTTALCDVFSESERGADVIMQSGGTLRNLVSTLKSIVGSRDNSGDSAATCVHAAGALTHLLNQGPEEKAAVIDAGGLEALMSLSSSTMGSQAMDPDTLRQVVYAMYSFVSDDELINNVARRIAPPTLAMKMIGMLSSPHMLVDQQTLEMLLLTVAILCGAKSDDHVAALPDLSEGGEAGQGNVVLASAAQTQELVGANGLGTIVPLLSGAQPPPMVLATLRVLLAISSTPKGAERLGASGGIAATVRALTMSLSMGHHAEPVELHQQLRLYSITVFGTLSSGKAKQGLDGNTLGEIQRGLGVLNDCISPERNGGQGSAMILEDDNVKYAAIRSIRELSFHSSLWEAIAQQNLAVILEILLADNANKHHQSFEYDADGNPTVGNELQMLMDIAVTISNLAKLEKHCVTVLESGGIFALVGLLSEKSDEAVVSGIKALSALAESSARCRATIVEQKAGKMLLQIAEQRGSQAMLFSGVEEEDDEDDMENLDLLNDAENVAWADASEKKRKQMRRALPLASLQCLAALARDAASASKLTAETGSMDTLLRLMKSPSPAIAGEALGVLLNVAQGSETVWEQLVLNADIQGSVALLKMGPPRVKGHACSTIASLCDASPGRALCDSPTVLDAIPDLVALLSPPDHLGADTSESPGLEAAAACATLGLHPSTLEAMYHANFVPALLMLLMRERRLGRATSATAEHTVHALNVFATHYVENGDDLLVVENSDADNQLTGPKGYQVIWAQAKDMGKRKDVVDALVFVLTAQMRSTTAPPSGMTLAQVATNVCQLLSEIPIGLTTAETSIIGRASRPLAQALEIKMDGSEVDAISCQEAALHTMSRLVKEPGLARMIASGGGVRAAAQILAPLNNADDEQSADELFAMKSGTFLEAALLLSYLVRTSKDKAVDDAVVSSNAVASLAALVSAASRAAVASQSNGSVGDENGGTLGEALEALASLSKGGAIVRKKVMRCTSLVPALISLVPTDGTQAESTTNMIATRGIQTLASLCVLDEHRSVIVETDAEFVDNLITYGLDLCNGECIDSALLELAYQLCLGTLSKNNENSATLGAFAKLACSVLAQQSRYDVEVVSCVVSYLDTLVSHQSLFVLDDEDSWTLDTILEFCAETLKPGGMDTDFKDVQQVKKLASVFSILESILRPVLIPERIEDDVMKAIMYVVQFLSNCSTKKLVAVPEMLILSSLMLLCTCSVEEYRRARVRSISNGQINGLLKNFATLHDEVSPIGFMTRRLLSVLGVPASVGDIVARVPKPIQKPASSVPPPPNPPPASVASTPTNIPSQSVASSQRQSFAPKTAQQQQRQPQRQVPNRVPSNRSLEGASVMSTSSKATLPTYSGSSPPMRPGAPSLPVPQKKRYVLSPASIQAQNSSSNSERASLELAMRLQREEEMARSGGSVRQSAAPTQSEWSCGSCTYANKPSDSTCSMCGAKKSSSRGGGGAAPPPPPAYRSLSSGQSSTVDVACRGCGLTLRAPRTAKAVRCPSCSNETPLR